MPSYYIRDKRLRTKKINTTNNEKRYKDVLTHEIVIGEDVPPA